MPQDIIPYDPGPLPSDRAPRSGESIELKLQGWPPWKDVHFSIRNISHRDHGRFCELRKAAIRAMRGRAWYRGPIRLFLRVQGPSLEPHRSLNDYADGVCDTLGGGHGTTFTYLPLVYEDDCQVCSIEARFLEAEQPSFTVCIEFLPDVNTDE